MDTDVGDVKAVASAGSPQMAAAGRSTDGEPTAKRATAAESIAALRFELAAANEAHVEMRDKYEALCLRMHAGAPEVLPRREALPVAVAAAFRSHGVAMLTLLQRLI
jgi:hypothetical protein